MVTLHAESVTAFGVADEGEERLLILEQASHQLRAPTNRQAAHGAKKNSTASAVAFVPRAVRCGSHACSCAG